MSEEYKPKVLVEKSLLAMIANAVGSHQFRNLYVQYPDGSEEDVLVNGELSCAIFVSCVLAGFGLIDRGHATVGSTMKALEKAGWVKHEATTEPQPGDVLLWEAVDFGNEGIHTHVGFYVGDGRAVSNSEKLGAPAEHDWQFAGSRAVTEIWRYDFARCSRD